MADTPDQPTEQKEAGFNPPETDAAGLVKIDGYPLNHRLRAEALVADGKSEDPAGHIAPDLIAATADRLAAEAAAEKEAASDAAAAARALRAMRVDEIREVATAEGVAVPEDATKSTIVDAIETARAAKSEG